MAYDLQNQPYAQVKHRWEQALNEQLSKGEWTELPEPSLMIENKRAPVSKEKAAEFLQNVGLEKLSPTRSSLAWAHKVIANPKGYPSISTTFAKQAFGVA